MPFEVLVKTSSFEKSPMSGSISGKIWIDVNERAFPEREWFDFPVKILAWWCEAYTDLCLERFQEVRFTFMDGPFELEFARESAEAWLTRLVKKCATGEIMTEGGSVRPCDIAESLIRTVAITLKECRKLQWQGDDIQTLEKAYTNLREVAAP